VTRGPSTGDGATRSFAIAGGTVFVFSLLYAAWSYASPFGLSTTGSTSVIAPAAVDIALFTAFALHHSVFARSRVRQWIAERVSSRLERSVYVWVASLLLLAVVAAWQPVAGDVWRFSAPWSMVLGAVQLAGVLVTLRASAALDVFSLAGVRQAFGAAAPPPSPLVETGLYRLVRHPVYFGWVLMVWPTPAMTGTRFVFAAISTLYLALAIPLEERSLRRQFGPAYSAYASKVKWKMVPGLY
jgi:protein-S-isoprenylcysteine O-methyltransferase Ste14